MATSQSSNTVVPFPGNPYLDCSQYSLSDLITPYWILIGASIFLNLILIVLWYIKKDLFPLKERSPLLVITSLIGNIFVQIAFPVAFIYEKTFDQPSPFAQYVIWSFLPFGGACLYMPYFWRAARLHHAFDMKTEHKFWDFLFSRQSVSIMITLVCGVIYSAILLTTLEQRSLEFYTEDNSHLNTHFASLAFIDFLKMGIMIIAAYELRFVKREFNFRNEVGWTFFVLFASFNLLFFIPFSQRNDDFTIYQGCHLIPFSTNMLISGIRSWLIIGGTAIYPLFIATRVHYLLSQEFVINIFHNILGDETCIEAFDEYVRSGRKRSGTLLYTSAYEANDEAELFRVFMSLRKRIMQGESCPKIIDRMMAEYVDNEKVSEFFPPAYIYELKREYRENRAAMTIESFDRLHGFCIYYFQDVFESRFKKTRSFQYIRDIFKRNEKINRRLHNLNLVSIK